MRARDNRLFEVVVQNTKIGTQQDSYYPIQLTTNYGQIHCRYYPVDDAHQAAVWVGGVGDGWDTPAQNLYPNLCEELQQHSIASLRVRYRNSTQLEEAVPDVLAGLSFLQDKGYDSIALIGHSFGGAVVIRAAIQAQSVRTVVALATQAYGTEDVARLATRCSLLLIHGTADPILPASCSQHVYDLALEPKHLVIYPNTGHNLDEAAADVHEMVRDWVVQQLNRNI